MIVWGGAQNSTFDTTGGLYNPRTNTWSAVSTVNAPPGKVDFGTVWTGSQMLVWGGQDPRGGPLQPDVEHVDADQPGQCRFRT
jgi:hypothetical protein